MLERAESVPSPDGFDPDDADIDDENADESVAAMARKSAAEIREEIATLDRLLALARSIERNKKGEKLVSLLRQLRKKGCAKFIIFTQFRTTQEYLRGLLVGFDVVLFHGSMDRDEKERAILDFKGDAEVLICTEAGGEGRNMQFCNILINYDLPWSPLKIEQRIGRIHRFGQPHDVFIYNFSTRDTVAERVLEVLEKKLRLFEESIGVPDAARPDRGRARPFEPVHGDGGGRKPRRESLRRSTNGSRTRDAATKAYRPHSRAEPGFQLRRILLNNMKERQFSNRRIERFVERMAQEDGLVGEYLGRKNARTGLYRIKRPVRTSPEAPCHGSFDSRVALENEGMEFLAFGHHVVDTLFEHCVSDAFGGKTGVKLIRSAVPYRGMVFCYLVSYNALSKTQEFLVVAADGTGRDQGELEEMEREFVEQEGVAANGEELDGRVRSVLSGLGRCLEDARRRLREKVERRLAELRETLELSIDPEIEKITEASLSRIKELSEQLERQECRQKWFGKDMRGALTRTRNEMAQVELERERLLAAYRRSREAKPEIRLVCAGVLIALPETLSPDVS